MKTLRLEELHALVVQVLVAANTSVANARSVAAALVAAEADGLASHGASRVPFYADQAACGKVDGQASPVLESRAPSAVQVDAREGFAYPAIRLGLDRGIAVAHELGVAGMAIANSHHCGALGYHVEHAATRGVLALGFSNTPSAMAPWGGYKPTFGTNPIAFAAPRTAAPPLVIDLSLSKVARGKIMTARQKGEAIPFGWALDAQGRSTTDPAAALAGTMVPMGEAKGAALAFMVEVLSAALTGSNFAYEASSFFDTQGSAPRIGQFFLVIDPRAFAGARFAERLEVLIAEMQSQEGVRLPGDRRLALREKSRKEGITLPEPLYQELLRRAAR